LKSCRSPGGTKCGVSNALNVATSLGSSFGSHAPIPVFSIDPDAKPCLRNLAIVRPAAKARADRCRRLASDSTDRVLQLTLCMLADDYQMKADELENDEILAKRFDDDD
jgi:hypothetical protein